MNRQTTYEFPLNERIRVFMRLEQLFQQLSHFMAGDSVFDKRAAVDTLLDILVIFGRADLKSELIKELDRHAKVLGMLSGSQDVDTQKLQEILSELTQASRNLYNASGKVGASVMESGLFQSISQRSTIPGGTCSFDLPAFHYWLEQDRADQQRDFQQWTQPFADIRNAIDLILGFIRQSSAPKQEIAQAGFFQLALDKSHPVQLLRVGVSASVGCFAEISGGKHRFSIRFMMPSSDENRPTQTPADISFSLSRCAV
ncbi:cell division protein ZapD [Methylomonas sp. SURF-2]|uniref:Cell division protein ZapD n=1 Tax=Methylomonas subterranea TaxID=2952225 RepID=A0ABT1TFM7_9GAMM|nr:cell division protein ZapD [Methylomonas sp. SURF-2]MCQ8104261.1 cell division protein ZapD [Methylomonas sp. SURF-2]